MDSPEIPPEQRELMSRAKRCEWAGVACLFALAALIFADIDFARLGVPHALEPFVGLGFLASWLLAAVTLLFRAGELKIGAKARGPEQKSDIQQALVVRRYAAACWMLALAMLCGGGSLVDVALRALRLPLVAAGPIAIVLLAGFVVAGIFLTNRANEMLLCASQT